MENRILGIDFDDHRTILSYYSEEGSKTIPTAICCDKTEKEWYIGSAAYEMVLGGKGIITDKLYSFVERNRRTTLYGKEYDASELLKQFFGLIIKDSINSGEGNYPTYIVLTLPHIEISTVAIIHKVFFDLGFDNDHVRIISRDEAFIYYTMSQGPDLHTNHVALFSLEDNELTYYELKVQKKAKTTMVFAEKVLLDESFNLDILSNDAGSKLADKILLSCAERLFKNKVYSSVFITGSGFKDPSWATEFMKYICNRKKVFADEELFSRGAGFRGAGLASERPLFNFIPICDGRIDASVYVNINKKDRVVPYPIISIGDSWYSYDREITFIPHNISTLDLSIVPMDERKRKNVKIPLSFLPERPDRVSTVLMKLHFADSKHISVVLKDLGFGDLFPSSDNTYYQEVTLWD